MTASYTPPSTSPYNAKHSPIRAANGKREKRDAWGVLMALPGLKKQGAGYMARCPAHDDAKPSLSIRKAHDGTILVRCFAKCSPEEVVASVGLNMPDLFPPEHDTRSDRRRVVERYEEFRATSGELKAVKKRTDLPNGDKDFFWYTPQGLLDDKAGLADWGLHECDLPLYRAPELLKAAHDEPVLFCEGGKATDAARAHGFTAVCNAGGASQRDFGVALQELEGRTVYLWPDNDDAGHTLMQSAGSALEGIAQEVKWLDLGDILPPAGDAYDYFAKAGTTDKLRRRMADAPSFRAIPNSHSLKELGSWELGADEGKEQPQDVSNQSVDFMGRVVRVWEEKEPPAREFIVEDIMPEGAVTSLFGDGGQGKSYLATKIGTHICLGLPFAGKKVLKRTVLFLDGELDADEFTRRAFKVARGMGLSGPPKGLHYYKLPGSLSHPAVQSAVREKVLGTDAQFIILDSLTMATFTEDAADPRAVISTMKFLETLGTVLVLDHIPKPGQGVNQSYYRQYGSVFKGNSARSVLQITRGDGGAIAVTHKKANFGPLVAPLYLNLVFEADEVRFEDVKPDDLGSLAGLEEHLPALERVYRALVGWEGQSGAKVEQLAEELEMKGKTVQNYLSLLKKQGRADSERGIWFVAPRNEEAPAGARREDKASF